VIKSAAADDADSVIRHGRGYTGRKGQELAFRMIVKSERNFSPVYPEAPHPGPLLVWRGEGAGSARRIMDARFKSHPSAKT